MAARPAPPEAELDSQPEEVETIPMRKRVYHGDITPGDLANALVAEFNHGGLAAQRVGEGDKVAVQIATQRWRQSGGRTALTATFQKVEDGVLVSLGQQEWMGIAASLGKTALSALVNPWSILDRLDDVAADVNHLQLENRVWQAIEHFTQSAGAAHEISERLRTVVCAYCDFANPVGAGSCEACGAPLGSQQPTACNNCGFVSETGAKFCSNCGTGLV
ncbi:MAG: zinc ribbon domain-containing protein [Anaerolineales bacterium]